MRGLGILCISLIPMILGIWQYFIINRRSNTLQEIEQLILLIKEQMRFSLKEIDSLLNFAHKQPNFTPPIKEIISAVKGKTDHSEILNSILSVKGSGITKSEAELLADFFTGLGKSDIKGQLEHCDYYLEQFDFLNQRMQQNLNEKSRLWLGLSISVSLAVFVLLI